jgi:predicted alpha/beta-fold hydrolase
LIELVCFGFRAWISTISIMKTVSRKDVVRQTHHPELSRRAKLAEGNISPTDYHAPWWLPGGHLQTIYARSLAQNYPVRYRRERWETPDDDFIDLDWLDDSSDNGRLMVLFHGLEGYAQSHYALSLMAIAVQLGWRGVVPHFRGCSGEANRLLRSYHSGDSREIDWILRRIKSGNRQSRVYVVGVSLGGNMLLKWLGEEREAALSVVERAVTVSTPVDLVAAAGELDFGIKRILYTEHFLRTMRPKALAKISTHGLSIDPRAVRASLTFRQFDELFTAPINDFKNAEDYWTRCSGKPWLKVITVPTLLLNAQYDPFLPSTVLPSVAEVSEAVTLEFPATGGHVGFVSGKFPGHLEWLPRRIIKFFSHGE